MSKRSGTDRRQRSVLVGVRLTPAEYAQIKADAEATGNSIPTILRAHYFGESA